MDQCYSLFSAYGAQATVGFLLSPVVLAFALFLFSFRDNVENRKFCSFQIVLQIWENVWKSVILLWL